LNWRKREEQDQSAQLRERGQGGQNGGWPAKNSGLEYVKRREIRARSSTGKEGKKRIEVYQKVLCTAEKGGIDAEHQRGSAKD